MTKLKTHLVAGLLVFTPILLTYYIFNSLLALIDSIFGPLLQSLGIDSLPIRITLTIAFILLLGLITKTRLGNYIYNKLSTLLDRTPIIKSIYTFSKETTHTILQKRSFNTVVRLKFGAISVIGFLTNENTVFVPTAPNVTSGVVLFTDQYEVINLTVEEAMKQIISMGTAKPKSR